MANAKSLYPPVIVRLALMAECARVLGYTGVPFGPDSWADILAQVSEPRRQAVINQLSRVTAAVAAVLDLKIGRGSLRRLADTGAAPAGARPDPIAVAFQRWLDGENVGLSPGRGLPRSAVREAFRTSGSDVSTSTADASGGLSSGADTSPEAELSPASPTWAPASLPRGNALTPAVLGSAHGQELGLSRSTRQQVPRGCGRTEPAKPEPAGTEPAGLGSRCRSWAKASSLL